MDWGASDEKPAVSAVFFTHYHGDLVGRFVEANKHARLYMSVLSREVLVNIHGYLAKNLPWLAKRKAQEGNEDVAAQILKEVKVHEEALKILETQGENRVRTFLPHEKKTITDFDDIRITPFWVDHSAGDACMFLIETEDKTILHTGDFRGHGLHGDDGKLMCDEIRSLAEQKQIDVLITEGTMMSRQNEKPYSEPELLKTATKFFSDPRNRYTFLIISSTNLDSISTFYKAARENGIHMYCHNPYVKKQLETLGNYAHKHWNLPDMKDVERVSLRDSEQHEKMRKDGFVTIIKANELGEELVQSFQDCNPVVIYSMWQGYVWRELDPALCGFLKRCRDRKIPIIPPNTLNRNASPEPRMHTSGHASPELITKVIQAANPKALHPIHAEDIRVFLNLDIAESLKKELLNVLEKEIEASGYRPEKDHRYLSKRSLEKFLDGGSHSRFVELVKSPPQELAFCFRGNSQGQVSIYYRNHIVFRIRATGRVEFDFGHAQFMEDKSELKEQLTGFGYEFKDGQETGLVSMSAERAAALTATQLKELFDCVNPMIDTFSDKEGLVEKTVQQQLFVSPGCKRLEDGYYFYDMEFTQPYGSRIGLKNKPDMMAIRFDPDGKPTHLVFVEVKSTPESLDGTSGVKPHVQGIENYPTALLPARRRDACGILNQYIALGLIQDRSTPFNPNDFEELPIEVMLIFTGDSASGNDTLKAVDDGGYHAFLDKMGYQVTNTAIPQPSEIKEMRVYRKELK